MRTYRLLFLIAFPLFSFIKDDLPLKIQDALVAYYKTHPREKISIQTNQSFYITGQTIWVFVPGARYDAKNRQVSAGANVERSVARSDGLGETAAFQAYIEGGSGAFCAVEPNFAVL